MNTREKGWNLEEGGWDQVDIAPAREDEPVNLKASL